MKKTTKVRNSSKKQEKPNVGDPLLPFISGVIQNGLSEAIMGFQPGGQGTQLSQVDTLFKNNRWYLVSNMRQVLSELYVEHGLLQTVVDVPVDDGFRGGIEISSKELDEDDINLLMDKMEDCDDLVILAQGLKWTRLFGGGGVVIITDQDPSTPLDWSKITEKSRLEFRAVDMWELFWSKQNTGDYATAIDAQEFDVEVFDYYGIPMHKSRVIKMKGLIAPSFIRPRLRGWGISVVEGIIRSINQYLKANNLSFEVLDEFKIDILKFKDLKNTLTQKGGNEKVRERIALANANKNYLNSIAMDADDDYQQKQLSFAGLSETMEGIRLQLASDLRMPISKLFGTGSTGFSSGQDDIENYNGMVESQVRNKAQHDVKKLVKIRCQQLFGFVPKDLKIKFKPLRVLSAEQEENVKDRKFARALQARQAGEISSKDFREICNKDSIFSIQVDPEEEIEPKQDEQKAKAPSAGAKSGTTPKEPSEPKS